MGRSNATLRSGTADDVEAIDALLSKPHIRVFQPVDAQSAGVFQTDCKPTRLLTKLPAEMIERLVARGTLRPLKITAKGRHFVPAGPRASTARTGADRHRAAWLAAERVFTSEDGSQRSIRVNLGESPLGWLARRKDARGRPFLDASEFTAGERLRADFERAQLGPAMAQDWRRFLTAGVEGGSRGSAQEREIGGGAEAARKRFAEAMALLGPGLDDVALRVCCFLEGLETVESTMNWSARSGKIVLKLALQRLADFYGTGAARGHAKIETWHAANT